MFASKKYKIVKYQLDSIWYYSIKKRVLWLWWFFVLEKVKGSYHYIGGWSYAPILFDTKQEAQQHIDNLTFEK